MFGASKPDIDGRAERVSQLEAELAETHRSVTQLANELEKANRHLERLSLYDTLTGLANRTLFYSQLERLVAVARREERLLPIMILDFNGFGEINDTLGPKVGDRVLQEVARRLVATIRESDSVARLGADEFAVVLPTTDSVSGARTVAEKILKAVETPLHINGHSVVLGISVGIAAFPIHGDDERMILRHADAAMHEAKRSGGYVVHGAENASRESSKVVLAGDVREAMKRQELVLHYQPKLDIASGRIIGAEALLRWPHPEYGLLYPDEFVPVVERTALISTVTLAVMDWALAMVRTWRTAGWNLNMAVNLSARALHDDDLPRRVEDLLQRHGVPPDSLILEITESAILIDTQKAMNVVSRLSERGVGISIDDFGTGYSSLAYLKRLPVCEIKIDKSFVMNMDHDDDDRAIVRSVIDLGKNLGLHVVAEGIENRTVLGLLREMGCHAGQGFFLARPLTESEFGAWIGSRKTTAPGARGGGTASTPTDVAAEALASEQAPRRSKAR